MIPLIWQWRNLGRLYRKYIRQERSKRRLIDCVGPFWLFRHGVVVEHRVSLWKGKGWYNPDLAVPNKKLAIEAKGGWRHYYEGDIARDQALIDKGWQVIRITEAEIEKDPKGVKRRVRAFIRG